MSVRNYAILYGGVRKVTGGASIAGGNAILGTEQHALDGPEHTGQLPETRLSTVETDTALVLKPDGAGGVEWGPADGADAELNIEGGQSVIKAHGLTGATETIDPTEGNVHTLILDADCTLTLNAPIGTGAALLEVRATQDGTGGWDITWPGSVVWIGGVAPDPDTTAGTTAIYLLESIDGGTNWAGIMVGGGASFGVPAIDYGVPAEGVATTTIRTDATLAPPDAADVPIADVGGYFDGSEVEAALQELAASLSADQGLLTVDPGTPTYDVSGADVVTSITSKWGYDVSGPYFNDAGVTSGDEAILAMDPIDGEFAVVPYAP